MRGRALAPILAIATLALAGSLASAAPARAGDPPPGVDLLAQRGFGDYRNDYSWSMAWFKGKLYVGTSRQEMCVENLTIDFYLPVLDQYKTGILPGVKCPANPWDMDLRAEIWRYTPQTKRWRRVYRSPADIPNPRARGKFVARDIGFRGMTVYHDGRGRKALYIGGVTADEILPSLKRSHPPRMLVTTDGRHFRAVPAHDTLIRNPFGTNRVIGFRSLVVLGGRLYVTLTGGLTGDGEVYEVKRPWGPNAQFKQISPKTIMVFEIEKFRDALYAGTGDRKTGYGVYKLTTRRPPYRWTPVVTNAAGRGSRITSVVSMHPYRGRLYVGSSGWYNDEIPQSELIRIAPSGRWDVVVGAPREVDGVTKAPVSGIGDGFNSIFAAHFWRMSTQDGGLYLGTNDWSWVLQLDQQWYPVAQAVLWWELGFDLWGTCNGRDWFPVTRDAFHADLSNFGARGLAPTRHGLFVGSANHAQGTSVWLDRQQPCQGRAAGAPAAARAHSTPKSPKWVVTDVQRDGTVVSWAGAARADRYRVLRAQQNPVSFSVKPPPALPHGFRTETQVPLPVAPGTPGSAAVEGTTLGPFRAIGSTASRHFVDRSRKRGLGYAYRVIAEGAGRQSEPSGVQFVPDLRPPATWEALEGAVGRASGVRRVRAAAALLRRGDRRHTLASLARLRRGARPGSTLEDLTMRLARRIRYQGLAGGRP